MVYQKQGGEALFHLHSIRLIIHCKGKVRRTLKCFRVLTLYSLKGGQLYNILKTSLTMDVQEQAKSRDHSARLRLPDDIS